MSARRAGQRQGTARWRWRGVVVWLCGPLLAVTAVAGCSPDAGDSAAPDQDTTSPASPAAPPTSPGPSGTGQPSPGPGSPTGPAKPSPPTSQPAPEPSSPSGGGPTPSGGGPTPAGGPAPPFDFDGDGHVDLAVGVEWEDIGPVSGAGAVHVLYGSADGPTDRDQLWHQNIRGVRGTAKPVEFFGWLLASGDFDGDGHADLAVTVPGEADRASWQGGGVQVLYGGPEGLTARDQLWRRGSPGMPAQPPPPDWLPSTFGIPLAAGDFDGDRRADLAIGSSHSGEIIVLPGSADGLTRDGAQAWTAQRIGAPGQWLALLTVGDLTGDGTDDLITTSRVPVESDDSQQGPGPPPELYVNVLPGSGTGLTADEVRTHSLDELGLAGVAVESLASAACGDFDGNGFADLAMRLTHNGPGVGVAMFGADGPQPDAATVWEDDQFDNPALTAGDLTGDGIDDLAIGRGMATTMAGLGGRVQVLAGSTDGLRQVALLAQGAGSLPGTDEKEDGFGAAVAILPGPPGAPGWLAIGVPYENLGDGPKAQYDTEGMIVVVPGAAGGVDPGGARIWHQDTPGITDTAEDGDGFGHRLNASTLA